MINALPTIFEVVTQADRKENKKSAVSNPSSNKSKSNSKLQASEAGKHSKSHPEEDADADEEEDDEDEDHGDALCGACGNDYGADEFWICCDVCEKWFHGKCVKITPAKAEHIKQYKCPSCTNKKPRH